MSAPAHTLHSDDATRLVALVAELARELGQPASVAVSLDTPLLERLGIDSLGRMELALRIEQAFRVRLLDEAALLAATPRALLDAIEAAGRGAGNSTLRGSARPEPAPAAGRAIDPPAAAGTLVDVLAWHVERWPERVHLTLLEGEQAQPISYGELDRRARAAAAGLGARGVGPGVRVALMLPTGADYFTCFLGVLLTGAVPVPIYPPARLDAIEEHLRRQSAILANAGVSALIAPRIAAFASPLLKQGVPTLEHFVAAEDLRAFASSDPQAPPVFPLPEDVALLQYTSGSTSLPKGVVLTHANLLANIRGIGHAFGLTAEDVVVTWLPLYHDMGLIGVWLSALYHAFPAVVLAPQAFLARPQRWLQAIHDYRGTITAAPNFAYEICASRLPEEALAGLDLSSWKHALNGAEPVSPQTISRFTERYARYGFRAESMAPVYGMAECSVALALPRARVPPRIDLVDRRRLEQEHIAIPVAADHADALQVPACGTAIEGHEIRIVDARGNVLGERRHGSIQFRGPSATSGYYRNEQATRQLLAGEWRETGDMGYLADNLIHVTGRSKDIVIRGGRNIYPHEIEETVGSVAGIRRGCVAVFGCADAARGTERIVIVAETRLAAPEHAALAERVRGAARALLDGDPDEVVLAPPGAVPKTSSGKLRRADCRARYLAGELGRQAPPWQARLKLATIVAGTALRSGGAGVAAGGYAGYAWLLLRASQLVGGIAVTTAPGVARRRQAMRAACRSFLRLAGIGLTIHGHEQLHHGPCLVVVNHQSYLDTIIMSALVPESFFFTPKRDLENEFMARTLMRRLDYPFVDRLDPKSGVGDLEAVKRRLRGGASAVVYPEGIFYPEPGLRHFYLGAFAVAAETGTPVVPIAIRGARAIWRGERPLLRRGSVVVSVGAPIRPAGSDWSSVLQLRTEARAWIAAHCGERDAAL